MADPAPPAAPETLLIARMGGRLDGIAEGPDGPVFVPYALPEERVLVERSGDRGRLLEVLEPSPARITPFCPYFYTCGGCLAQHIAWDAYAAWKTGTAATALSRAGLDPAVIEPLVDAFGEGRRRLTFHARQREGRTEVGFMAVRSHTLVDIAHCPISTPALAPAPPVARALAAALARAKKPLDIAVTATEAGLDVDIRGHGPLSERERAALIAKAEELDLARLSNHGEILVERRPPLVRMGRAAVALPPGGFLQATAQGEETLSAAVLAACKGAKRVADLFAGCGPFSLRLAEGAEVHAVEQDRGALAALDRAFRGTPGLRRITTEPRDLFHRPLLPLELARFDAVVMDPPRAGAEAQARQLAASKVPVVASVSCDPGTFARDGAILAAGGYILERVVPVDQFKYSAHLELVGVFRKAAAKRRR